MIKSEFISLLASRHHQLPEEDVTNCVNIIIDLMTETLCDCRRIEIRGFGSFSNHLRHARNAHNPKTGDKVITKEKYTPHFKPGKLLRERVDGSRLETPLKREDLDDEGSETGGNASGKGSTWY